MNGQDHPPSEPSPILTAAAAATTTTSPSSSSSSPLAIKRPVAIRPSTPKQSSSPPLQADDPLVSLAIAHHVRSAYDAQLDEIKHCLLREQRRRLGKIESLLPSRGDRLAKAIERRAKELVNKASSSSGSSKTTPAKSSFLLPDPMVPDALEIWSFCWAHEHALRVEIGTFQEFEKSLLENEPNATLDAVACGLLGVLQENRRLVNELTWPEIARRVLISAASKKMIESATGGEGEVVVKQELVEQHEEEEKEIIRPTWRELERNPDALFSKGEKQEEDDELYVRLMGVMNKLKVNPFARTLYSIDYRALVDPYNKHSSASLGVSAQEEADEEEGQQTERKRPRLSDTREIPALADLCALEEGIRARIYSNASQFEKDFLHCMENLRQIFRPKVEVPVVPEAKKPATPNVANRPKRKKGKKEKEEEELVPVVAPEPEVNAAAEVILKDFLQAVEVTCQRFEEVFKVWVVDPPLTERKGPWLVWASSDPAELEVCKICKGTKKLLKKSSNAVALVHLCRRCQVPYHAECYPDPAPNPEEFLCPICVACETASATYHGTKNESMPPPPEVASEKTKKKKLLTADVSRPLYGLCEGQETSVSLLSLAEKLGKCEPADLEVKDRLRLLLFLCREAGGTDACRQEAEETVLHSKELQGEFTKHKKYWLDDAREIIQTCLQKFASNFKRDIEKKDKEHVLHVLNREFLQEEERESIKEYIDRARSFVSRGGFLRELECRLPGSPGRIEEQEVKLDVEDEQVPDEEYSQETESEFDDDDDFVEYVGIKPRNNNKTKVVVVAPLTTKKFNVKRLDLFFRTLDPESIPVLNAQEVCLAKSVDVGPPIAKLELKIRPEFLPLNHPEHVHPAMFDHDLSVSLEDRQSSHEFDCTKTSPVFLGLSNQVIPSVEADDEPVQQEKKRQRRSKNSPATATDEPPKRRKPGPVPGAAAAAAAAAALAAEQEEPKLLSGSSCSLCGFSFVNLAREMHGECLTVYEKMNQALKATLDSNQEMAMVLWQAEHDSIPSLLRTDPVLQDDKYRYWRFRGDLTTIFMEDLDTGTFSKCAGDKLDFCPLQVKWFLVGALSATVAHSVTGTVSGGRVKYLLPSVLTGKKDLNLGGNARSAASHAVAQGMSQAALLKPIVLDDIKLRSQMLLDSSKEQQCLFCCDDLTAQHCQSCHRTFAEGVEHTCNVIMHPLDTRAWTKFLRLKRFVIDLEAALPLQATRFKTEGLKGDITSEQRQKLRILAGGWETERRAAWIDRVRRSVTPLQLFKLIRVLEQTIDPRWLAQPSAFTPIKIPVLSEVQVPMEHLGGTVSPLNVPLEGSSSITTHAAEVEMMEEDPLVNVVVAKVALKVFALDQDVRFECVS